LYLETLTCFRYIGICKQWQQGEVMNEFQARKHSGKRRHPMRESKQGAGC